MTVSVCTYALYMYNLCMLFSHINTCYYLHIYYALYILYLIIYALLLPHREKSYNMIL